MRNSKCLLRKLAVPVLGAALIGSCMMKPMVALADSSEVNGDLNGYACRGTVSINSRDAYAVTTFARGNANITAEVKLVTFDGKKGLYIKDMGLPQLEALWQRQVLTAELR
ncbi:MAG: hypothetical protein SPL57_00070 [Lachnospiraceae bacterium]|nr:hypothetical protein [Lachnospiraceae bacterium]